MQNDVIQNETTGHKSLSKKQLIILIILCICFLPIVLTVIIAKSKKLKKSVKAGLIAIVWIITLIVGAVNSDNTNSPDLITPSTPDYSNEEITDDVIGQFDAVAQPTEEPTTASVFATFEESSLTIEVGENQDCSIVIMRNDISADLISFENSDITAVSIENISVVNNEENSILHFTCSALASGTANIRIYIPSENIYSDYLFVTAKITPKIESFGYLSSYTQRMEEDDTESYTIELTPGTVTEDDFDFIVSDTSVISVSDVQITNEEEKTIVAFSIYANGAGAATLQLKATDELSESTVMSFEVEEKDTSPTVYTTPTGKKYHYSKSCAGSNAIATTLNKASKMYDPCKNCAQ